MLCWLLIFQHLNVYVLHAAPGDISIIFEKLEGEKSRPSKVLIPHRQNNSSQSKNYSSLEGHSLRSSLLGLKILKDGNKIFKGSFEVDPVSPLHFMEQKVKPGAQGISIGFNSDLKAIHILLALRGNEFSLHLNPNGTILCQGMNFLNHL